MLVTNFFSGEWVFLEFMYDVKVVLLRCSRFWGFPSPTLVYDFYCIFSSHGLLEHSKYWSEYSSLIPEGLAQFDISYIQTKPLNQVINRWVEQLNQVFLSREITNLCWDQHFRSRVIRVLVHDLIWDCICCLAFDIDVLAQGVKVLSAGFRGNCRGQLLSRKQWWEYIYLVTSHEHWGAF